MRRIGFLSLALSAALLPAACHSSSSSPISDATAAAKSKRDEFIGEMQKKLDVLDAKYQALEKQAAEAKGDAKTELGAKLKVAKAKRDTAVEKLGELKEASHDRWEKVKDGVGSAYEDLKKVFE